MNGLEALPAWALVAIGVLILVQLTLQVLALVRLFRTPDDRLALGNRWIWVAIIVLGEILGAVVFLAAGVKQAIVADPASGAAPGVPAADRAARAADVLYGPEGDDRA